MTVTELYASRIDAIKRAIEIGAITHEELVAAYYADLADEIFDNVLKEL